MKRVFVFGAGGHGKVVCDILQRQGLLIEAFVDSNPQKPTHFGRPIIAESQLPTEVDFQILIAIGSNFLRSNVARRIAMTHTNAEFITAIHPSAVVAPSAKIGAGTVVAAGAIVGADSNIGEHCVLNTGSQVDHDCKLGEAVSVAPGAVLGGGVLVGDFSYIALGSCLIHGISVGEHTVVGAGSTVTKSLGDRVVAYGSPCRVIRRRSEDDRYL